MAQLQVVPGLHSCAPNLQEIDMTLMQHDQMCVLCKQNVRKPKAPAADFRDVRGIGAGLDGVASGHRNAALALLGLNITLQAEIAAILAPALAPAIFHSVVRDASLLQQFVVIS